MTPQEQAEADKLQLMERLRAHVHQAWSALRPDLGDLATGAAQKIQVALAASYGAGAIEERETMAIEGQEVTQRMLDMQGQIDMLTTEVQRLIALAPAVTPTALPGAPAAEPTVEVVPVVAAKP